MSEYDLVSSYSRAQPLQKNAKFYDSGLLSTILTHEPVPVLDSEVANCIINSV